MRIALVIFRADPARGGAERYTADLAVALRERGHAVSIVCAEGGPALPGVEQVVLRARGLTRAAKYARFLNGLDVHLDRAGYDVVHAMLPVRRCDFYHPHAGVEAENVQQTASVQRVLNRFNAKRRAFVRAERDLLSGPRPPAVLCLSEYVKSAVRRHYAIPEDRLITLFNGVDTARFDPAARPDAGRALRLSLQKEKGLAIGPERIVALMIANDFARKGLRQAIDAVAAVNDPRLLLLVVGNPDPFDYAAHAMRLGLHARTAFVGPAADPYAFYSLADFFVLPTRHDPCSLVVLEALAMGLPVISTRANGACEIMADGLEGFVLESPDDIAALAKSMSSLLDVDRRRQMSQAARALRPRLSQEAHVDKLVAAYEAIDESKPEAP